MLADRIRTNAFAFRLFNALVEQDRGQNVFMSPLSVLLALSMAASGAAGKTQREMVAALDLGDIGMDELNRACADLMRDLNSVPQVTLAIANSLWANEQVEFKADFLQRARTFFHAEVASLNFGDQRTVAAINGWVSEHTRGKIAQIVDHVDPRAIMFLINAIYFKGNWTKQFDPQQTRERPFTLANGAQKQHPMMAQSGKYRYHESREFQAISLPYGDERLSMYIFLPAQRSSVKTFLKTLTAQQWGAWMRQFHEADGTITLPRFRLEYETTLNDVLKQLGMASAFDPRRADFSAMADARPIYIDEVRHKTFVEVNEEGTEAAAVTSIGIRLAAFVPPKRFTMIVDRPFVCAIVDNQTGMPLFLGAIVEPS
jgi:serine protease inhibitor